ncbi:aldose 1-epimerase family protein [Spirosoma sp. KUDC1026]|uniref:aldose 1-epimerase family protein n=1 Tax=Spirosoma sp. KUDC1026 TaxID=2745947 RepID=UPI00159BAAD5|nr:aldose 1-epimerase family protein [Spirosoma sp. KUDC1026]QKZ12002.1 aldose 1-epimerase family protein [Spirosoma sp. KUDC1026]
MATLENDTLRIVIQEKGAELTSIFDKKNTIEHLWQADPAVWPWHAPNLFPVVGGCLNNQLLIDGKAYPMQRHGFARQSQFTLKEVTDTRATFSLAANAQTKAAYPYLFEFQIAYELQEDKLDITYRVVNQDDKTVFFSVGAHPAFAVPFLDGEAYEDYYLEFETDEPLETAMLSAEGYFTGETKPIPTENNRLALTKHLFDDDALVFKHINSRSVTIRSTKNERAVTVAYDKFPYLGVWAKPGAPFVCIEPWLGCADSVGEQLPIEQKELIQQVAVGETFSATFSIQIS